MLDKMIKAALSFNKCPGKPTRERQEQKQESEKKTRKSKTKWTPEQQTSDTTGAIGRYNVSGMADLLKEFGFKYCSDASDGNTGWTRPGKCDGISLTTKEINGVEIAYPFSSSIPELEAGRGYSKFQLLMAFKGLTAKQAYKYICKQGYAPPTKADEALAELMKVVEFNLNDEGHIKSNDLTNAVNIFLYHKPFQGLYHNVLMGRIVLSEDFCGYKGVLKDESFSLIRLYFENQLGLYFDDSVLRHALNIVAIKRRRNPFIERIQTFVWDHVERCKTILHDAFRLPQNKLTEEVGLKLLVAAIARSMTDEPIEMCWFPIFVGEQKVGKTSFFKNLCKWIHPNESYEWYSGCMDMVSYCDPAKRKELSEGAVFATIDDMKNVKKADFENFKSALSQPRSMTRLAYGHYSQELIQRFGLVGTGNLDEFLTDATGNRRFIVLRIPLKRYECIMYRDGIFNKYVAEQLMAEALDWYKKNYHSPLDLELSDEAQRIADENAEDAFRQLPWENTVRDYVDFFRKSPDNGYVITVDETNKTVTLDENIRENFFTCDNIYKYIAGGEDNCIVNMKPADRDQIVNCLRRLDCVERSRKKNIRGYRIIPAHNVYNFDDYKSPVEQTGLEMLLTSWQDREPNKTSIYVNRGLSTGYNYRYYPMPTDTNEH